MLQFCVVGKVKAYKSHSQFEPLDLAGGGEVSRLERPDEAGHEALNVAVQAYRP